jgi:hypothetical protein
VHWAVGGPTRLDNLLLLCRRHHRRVHEGGVTVCMDRDRRVVFFNPDGKAIAGAPPIGLDTQKNCPRRPDAPLGSPLEPDAPDAPDHVAHTDHPAEHIRRRNRARGVQPDPRTNHPPYARDSLIPWSTEAAAWHALDPP